MVTRPPLPAAVAARYLHEAEVMLRRGQSQPFAADVLEYLADGPDPIIAAHAERALEKRYA